MTATTTRQIVRDLLATTMLAFGLAALKA